MLLEPSSSKISKHFVYEEVSIQLQDLGLLALLFCVQGGSNYAVFQNYYIILIKFI